VDVDLDDARVGGDGELLQPMVARRTESNFARRADPAAMRYTLV